MSVSFRVGLDLRALEEGFKAHLGRGTGRYVQELSRHLVEQTSGRGEGKNRLEIVPLHSKDLCTSDKLRGLFQRIPFGRQTLETHLYLPRVLPHLNIDLMHFFSHGDAPGFDLMSRLGRRGGRRVPIVLTILDLIPLKFRALYRPSSAPASWRYDLARMLERRSIRNATGMLAISEATKRDLVTLLGIHPDRVFVTPLAVGNEFCPGPPSALGRAVRERLGVGKGLSQQEPLLLYVGGIDPRKNVFFLLELAARLRVHFPKLRLAFVGRYEREREFPEFMRRVRELNLESVISLEGYISDAQLPEYYRAADLFLFPSLYEGFGFPPLEAMACGTPVLAGKNSSMPEIFGGDTELLPDGALQEWADACLGVLTNGDLRGGMVERGMKRAGYFSWEHTAEMTLEAYRYFLAGEGSEIHLKKARG